MRTLKELFRCKFEFGFSNRKTARSCNVSHTAVSDYVSRFEISGLSWPLCPDMTEEELREHLFPEKELCRKRKGHSRPLPDFEEMYRELKSHKHMTVKLLWQEYREKHPDGYGLSQFCHLFQGWRKSLDVSFRQTYRGGEKMLVDYAGQKVKVIDRFSGSMHEASIFVAVLGASNYTYAEAQTGQDAENWIGGHVRALEYFKGVPEIVVPDNLKSGVKSPCFYDPTINPTYNDMARHYGLAVIPARIRKPKDKAKVETGVRIVGQQILAVLRKRTFFSLGELNHAIRQLLEDLNNREMQLLKASRKELYQKLDAPNLKPLPQVPYEFAIWKKATVGVDYHVRFLDNYYSVPYRFSGKKTDVRATKRTVEIYYRHECIASHLRVLGKNQSSTVKEHMPKKHQYMCDWNEGRFIGWARKIGENTERLIRKVLEEKEHPQQSFRKCMGILSLSKRYGDERLEKASERALEHNSCSYKKIKNILDKGLDKINTSHHNKWKQDGWQDLNHKNIRGSHYYRNEEKNREPKSDHLSQKSLDFMELYHQIKSKYETHDNH